MTTPIPVEVRIFRDSVADRQRWRCVTACVLCALLAACARTGPVSESVTDADVTEYADADPELSVPDVEGAPPDVASPTAPLSPPGAEAPVPQAFTDWVAQLRVEAIEQRHIKPKTFDAAFAGVRPIARVVELDRQQPESVMTFDDYVRRIVSDARIARGKAMLAKHTAMLRKITTEYHVQPRFLVAFWGIESDYGRIGGKFPVIGALATLAYEGRRGAFFRKELLEALAILDAGDVSASRMRGSWAGAMGQTQFMPSTFRAYAVDFNHDGRRDVWNNLDDVLASAANYLARIGWNDKETWGREVTLPAQATAQWIGLEQRKNMSAWQALGVRRVDGSDLPNSDLNASLIQPGGANGRAFLVYDNYRVILQWNRSTHFATAVGLLADALSDAE